MTQPPRPLALRDEVVSRFRFGQDTWAIAQVLGVPETEVCRELAAARDEDFARREQAACDAWNAGLEPKEQRE